MSHILVPECSTTASSDDVEKQELEEVSDEDEKSFYDTKDYFTEPTIICRSSKATVNNVDKHTKRESQFHNVDKVETQMEGNNSRYPHVERRKKLPNPVEKEKGVSLWSMIKDNVGKDLTRVCLPVYFNEPISSLQKGCEDMEYSYLLDRAYEHGKVV